MANGFWLVGELFVSIFYFLLGIMVSPVIHLVARNQECILSIFMIIITLFVMPKLPQTNEWMKFYLGWLIIVYIYFVSQGKKLLGG